MFRLILWLGTGWFCVTSAQAAEKAFIFDHDTAGQAPAGLIGDGDAWRVVSEKRASSAPNVLLPPRSLLAGGTASFLQVEKSSFTSGDLGFRFRLLNDNQGGVIGFFWRYEDPENFYSAQLDFGSETVSLLRVVKGKTKVLATEGVLLTAHLWHRLQIQVNGSSFSIFYDDMPVLSAKDKSLHKPGALGLLATPGEAVQLDDFAYRTR
jgi:hypothetical protein